MGLPFSSQAVQSEDNLTKSDQIALLLIHIDKYTLKSKGKSMEVWLTKSIHKCATVTPMCLYIVKGVRRNLQYGFDEPPTQDDSNPPAARPVS